MPKRLCAEFSKIIWTKIQKYICFKSDLTWIYWKTVHDNFSPPFFPHKSDLAPIPPPPFAYEYASFLIFLQFIFSLFFRFRYLHPCWFRKPEKRENEGKRREGKKIQFVKNIRISTYVAGWLDVASRHDHEQEEEEDGLHSSGGGRLNKRGRMKIGICLPLSLPHRICKKKIEFISSMPWNEDFLFILCL